MKIRQLAILCLLAACDSGEAPPARPKQIALRCGNYDVAVEMVDGDRIRTAINGEKIDMFAAVSASGAKYSGRGAVVSASVWNKGQDWFLELDGGRLIKCKALK